MGDKLKAPFPYFGGKSKVASLVWDRIGDVSNYIEPFAGSCAVLLSRPHPPRVETINDLDANVSNFWRATQQDPEGVAGHADYPVSELDMHARHRWLVLGEGAAEFREKMRVDPDYYDVKRAGFWVWGACCWIGGGWCQTPKTAEWKTRPTIGNPGSGEGHGVCGEPPEGSGGFAQKIPRMTNDVALRAGPRDKQITGSVAWQQVPDLASNGSGGCGVHAKGRPQLGDAYARGRGVHGNDNAGTCAERRAWLLDWFSRLRDRLRTVRVCCGDWLRVCGSESVTTRLGVTGVFLDPPYSTEAGRDMSLYATESATVAHEVRKWCLERGGDPMMRIVLAGYCGEGHEELVEHGWQEVAWRAQGGYGNRSTKGKENAAKERLWFSPHCRNQRGLFDALEATP